MRNRARRSDLLVEKVGPTLERKFSVVPTAVRNVCSLWSVLPVAASTIYFGSVFGVSNCTKDFKKAIMRRWCVAKNQQKKLQRNATI